MTSIDLEALLAEALERGREAKNLIHALDEISETGEDAFGDLLVDVVWLHDTLTDALRKIERQAKAEVWDQMIRQIGTSAQAQAVRSLAQNLSECYPHKGLGEINQMARDEVNPYLG